MQSRARTAGAFALATFSTAMTATLAPSTAFAHGAPEFPISRQYNCYKNPSLPACQAGWGRTTSSATSTSATGSRT